MLPWVKRDVLAQVWAFPVRSVAGKRARSQCLEPLLRGWIRIVVEPVGIESERNDLELALRRASSCFTDISEERRGNHSRQRGDDRDDDKQLDECEAAPRATNRVTITPERHGIPPR